MRMKVLNLTALAALLFAPAAHAQSVPSLPKEMQGVWALDLADCDDEDSDGRVSVGPKRVDSFAASFVFREIRKSKDGYRATTRRFDEGEERVSKDAIDLKILPNGKLKIISSTAADVEYRRCPARMKPVR